MISRRELYESALVAQIDNNSIHVCIINVYLCTLFDRVSREEAHALSPVFWEKTKKNRMATTHHHRWTEIRPCLNRACLPSLFLFLFSCDFYLLFIWPFLIFVIDTLTETNYRYLCLLCRATESGSRRRNRQQQHTKQKREKSCLLSLFTHPQGHPAAAALRRDFPHEQLGAPASVEIYEKRDA